MWIIIFIKINKWIPPYWDNKTLPGPTKPDKHYNIKYLCFQVLLISCIFIENKCLSDLISDEKREKNKLGKKRTWTLVDHVKS